MRPMRANELPRRQIRDRSVVPEPSIVNADATPTGLSETPPGGRWTIVGSVAIVRDALDPDRLDPIAPILRIDEP